jgi:hypothetical protein
MKLKELKLEVEKPLSQRAFEAAVKTMRKTGLYGANTRVNVEWPTASVLLQMANNIPTKIKEFLLRSSTADSNYFGAFQVILSNGVASPVFNAANQNF